MSEEIKKTGTEINESALEGVSGGSDKEQRALEIAKNTCAECKRDGVQPCNGGNPEMVARHISNLGGGMFVKQGYFRYTGCPYAADGPVG